MGAELQGQCGLLFSNEPEAVVVKCVHCTTPLHHTAAPPQQRSNDGPPAPPAHAGVANVGVRACRWFTDYECADFARAGSVRSTDTCRSPVISQLATMGR